MTNFEPNNDYRTIPFEALSILGLNRENFASANDYHELYSHLTPAKQQLALAAVETYRLYSFRKKKEKILCSDDIYNHMKVELNEGKL